MTYGLAALWSLRFQSNRGIHGGGVVVVHNGKILGGETGYIYIGSLRKDRGQLAVRMRVSKYVTGVKSILGLDHFHMELTGPPDGNQIRLDGFIVGTPQQDISIDMVRRAELP